MTCNDVSQVLNGLIFTLVIGQVVVMAFIQLASDFTRVEKPFKGGMSPWFLGAFERLLVFAIVYALEPENSSALVLGWVAAKFAVTWKRTGTTDTTQEQRYRTYSLIALMATVISIAVAFAGAIAALERFLPNWPLGCA